MTAAAWRTSAGAAARVPVARATNLTRALEDYKKAGLFVAGLAADGDIAIDALEVAADPLVLVVGSEGAGLGRLVAQTCDVWSGSRSGPTRSRSTRAWPQGSRSTRSPANARADHRQDALTRQPRPPASR
jgi:23S rRNA (guanosine2251-2'-O)-methyltransferase